MRGRFEGAVNVPAATLRQDVEVSTGSEDDDTPLVGAVVVKEHVGTTESLAARSSERTNSAREVGALGLGFNLLRAR